jgi:hypothetical protein
MKTDLCNIMTSKGSDKGNNWHNYTIYYDNLFKDKKYNKLNIFELGLGTNDISLPSNMGKEGIPGASLRGWREYFLNSNIYGADIDKKILFNEDRIDTFYCDQTDEKSIYNLWENKKIKHILFDIMIDDGLHSVFANINFLKHSLYKLNKNGFYIIEDILNEEVNTFKDELNKIKNITYTLLEFPHEKNIYDNRICVIQHAAYF